MAGSFRELQPPCRAWRLEDKPPYLARFSASANDTFGQTKIVIRFSPVTDAIGRIRRCQRSTCITAALPRAPARKEKFILRGIPPRSVGMIAFRLFCVNAVPPKLAQKYPRQKTLRCNFCRFPKRKFRLQHLVGNSSFNYREHLIEFNSVHFVDSPHLKLEFVLVVVLPR